MAKALTLRHRPRRFDDLVGNDLIVTILRNSLVRKELRQAYFFAGTKGSGKTTTVRIFAKAINCTGRGEMDPEPCNACQSCQEADHGSLTSDILEIDAASNNGVEAIRTLMSRLDYLPRSGKFRIIILDEVHMLSTAAFNSMLKTLEEPPAHVVFMFCTTDPNKVIDTVRSRCLNFQFERLKTAEIANRLAVIASREKLPVDFDALEMIARSVNGAMRDAVTLLDQASILASPSTVSVGIITKLIGYVSMDLLIKLFTAVTSKDDKTALAWLEVDVADKLDQDIMISVLDFIEAMITLQLGLPASVPPDFEGKIKMLASGFPLKALFEMGDLVKNTVLDYRRLALRDSKVLLRLMLVGFVLIRDGQSSLSSIPKQSIFDLVGAGRNIEFDPIAKLRQLFNAVPVSLEESEAAPAQDPH